MTNDLNDSLDALFAGDTGPVRTTAAIDRPAAREHIERTTAPGFVQICGSCGGSGVWNGRLGFPCFKCKGHGKRTFKTSPEQRAQASASRTERKAAREQDWREAHKAEIEWIERNAARQLRGPQITWDFPVSMQQKLNEFGSLTDGQLEAIQKCMARDAAWAQERAQVVQSAPQVDASRIEAAFATARSKAARPGQRGVMVKPLGLTSSEETGKLTVRFTPGSVGSQWEGMLFAKTDAGKKLGHIKAGKFVRKFDCSDAEQAAVLDCASDPEKAVKAFAKAWSCCGICGQTLLKDESIERGIGPICAAKFGFSL